MDRGKEFVAKVQDTIHNKYDIKKKLITTQNPQANAMVEQVHQTAHNMVHSLKVQGKQNLDLISVGLEFLVRFAKQLSEQFTPQIKPHHLN